MENPLVSVIVLSYNSSRTIRETLESVRNQTYDNLELIVSDDGSQDSSLEIIEKWITDNGERFKIKRVITVPQNTGTPANCNRAVKMASGRWAKMIAGDDLLMPNCVADFVALFQEASYIRIAFSNYYGFDSLGGENRIVKDFFADEVINAFDTTPKEQIYQYIERGTNISPSIFFETRLVEELGFFIEKYRVFEDTPFYLKVLKSGIKIYHLPKHTVMYRIGSESVTTDASGRFFFKKVFVDNLLQFRRDMVFPLYKWYHFHFWIKEYSFRALYAFTVNVLNNRKTKFTKCIYYIAKASIPYYLITWIGSFLHK